MCFPPFLWCTFAFFFVFFVYPQSSPASLSYTNFTLSWTREPSLVLPTAAPKLAQRSEGIVVEQLSVVVTNIGPVAGDEVRREGTCASSEPIVSSRLGVALLLAGCDGVLYAVKRNVVDASSWRW